MSSITLRQATQDDLRKYYRDPLKQSTRAVVVEMDGDIVMVAGILHQQPLTAFMDMDDRLRVHPKILVSGINLFREVLSLYGAPVYAKANPDEKNAPRYLKRVGFQELHGNMFVWVPQHFSK